MNDKNDLEQNLRVLQNGESTEELDEFDLFLSELIPAILGDDSKTDIKNLNEEDFNEVIKFIAGMMQQDFTE